MEIALCAAQVEKLPEAIAQLECALQLDSGQNAIGPGAGEQRERIDHLLHRLRLRADLYQQPESPEDRAAMILEQVASCFSSRVFLCVCLSCLMQCSNLLFSCSSSNF